MTQTATPLPLHANHSHSQIVRRVPRYARVLELGCADGSMSRLLKQHCEASIIGVEQNPHAASQARCFCDDVLTENLDDPHSLDALEGEKFDVVTLVDVLEHLQHPQALLQRLKPLLLDEGCLLLSVPNVAHASVRLELLRGDFNYEANGILDRTHLRFFTATTLQHTLIEAGYVLQELDYTWHDLADTVITEQLTALDIPVTPAVLARFHTPEAMAYQLIAAARSAPEVTTSAPTLPLKPLTASQDTWAGLQQALAQTHQQLLEAKAELERVYATRSWQALRRGANAWRSIQSRFTSF